MAANNKRKTNLVRGYDGLRTTWLCEHCVVLNSVENTLCEGCQKPRDPNAPPDWSVGDTCKSEMGRGTIREIREDDIFVVALQWRLGNRHSVLAYLHRDTITIPSDCLQPPADTVLRFFLPTLLINRGMPDFLEIIPALLASDSALKTVYLRYQGIGDEGTTILVSALARNTSVLNVMLGNNNISDIGAKAVASLLKVNSTITSLDLSGNSSISAEGAKHISDALSPNTSVVDVNLSSNNMRHEGVLAAVQCLFTNRTIRSMMVGNNNLAPPESRAVLKLLAPHNRHVQLVV